jgi:hypothetical protein
MPISLRKEGGRASHEEWFFLAPHSFICAPNFVFEASVQMVAEGIIFWDSATGLEEGLEPLQQRIDLGSRKPGLETLRRLGESVGYFWALDVTSCVQNVQLEDEHGSSIYHLIRARRACPLRY